MLVQLNLFGEDPIPEQKKSEATKPRKYKLVPPPVVKVEEEKVPDFNKENERIKKSTVEKVEAPIIETVTNIEFEEPFLSSKEKEPKKTGSKININTSDVQELLNSIPSDAVLQEKLYYPIGEVANMFKVNISLIRFWEKEFDILKPRKNRKGDRLFRPEDIKNLKLIYFLLREKKYTIKGAKSFLKKGNKISSNFEVIETLSKLKQLLIEIKSEIK